jgi:hypothetical protein
MPNRPFAPRQLRTARMGAVDVELRICLLTGSLRSAAFGYGVLLLNSSGLLAYGPGDSLFSCGWEDELRR